MKTQYAVSGSLLVGIAVGAFAIQTLHAQTTPPVYAVIDIESITNAEAYKAIFAKAQASASASGGKFIIRTDKITAADGKPPTRFALIAFDSMAKAEAWKASAAQKEVDDIRLKNSVSRQFFAEGTPQ
jgi:uncharacterized protein (DUF1330 family)